MSFESEVDFALKLLSLIDNSASDSVVFSPASILNGFAMVFAGAKGKTAEEIQQLLGKDCSTEEIIQYYSNSIKGFNDNLKFEKDSKMTVKFANKLFLSKDKTLIPEFSEIIKNYFNGKIQNVNFKEKVKTAKEINNFVCQETNEQIKEITNTEEINSESSLILINALYFSSAWENVFLEPTKEIFYSDPPREVEMMWKVLTDNHEWNIVESEEWITLGIPYKNYKAWMYIILPKEKDGLSNVISKMNYKMLLKSIKRNKNKYLKVWIPVFEVESNFSLEKLFPKLGVTRVFSDSCDLTGMTSENGKIEKIIHKAVIKVDENGTEASAATSFDIIPLCRIKIFRADHPFLYFITRNEPSKDETKHLDLLFAGTFS